MIDLEKLEKLAKAAPSGQWEVWTSNSWRRVMAGNTPAIVPCVQRYDNHPDLSLASGVKEWLEGVTPETVLALVAEVRRLRDGEPNMRHPKIQHLLSQKARLAIELSIVESLVTDPEYEPTPMDGDYWSTLCDKVSDMAKAARGAK